MEISTAQQTEGAALAARDRIGALARSGGSMEAKMAAAARTAIFEEALLGAIHARLAEIKSVTK